MILVIMAEAGRRGRKLMEAFFLSLVGKFGRGGWQKLALRNGRFHKNRADIMKMTPENMKRYPTCEPDENY